MQGRCSQASMAASRAIVACDVRDSSTAGRLLLRTVSFCTTCTTLRQQLIIIVILPPCTSLSSCCSSCCTPCWPTCTTAYPRPARPAPPPVSAAARSRPFSMNMHLVKAARNIHSTLDARRILNPATPGKVPARRHPSQFEIGLVPLLHRSNVC